MFSFKLTPRNDVFFVILERASTQAVEAARLLCDLVNDYTNVPQKVQRLTEAEKKADNINHEMVQQLSKTFVTPFDRDDLHRLAFSIDDIVDAIEEVGILMLLCKVTKPTPYAVKMAALVLDATARLNTLMPNLRNMRDGQTQYIAIHDLENQGDTLWQEAFASLFEDGSNPLEAIKWKEIYENFEKALDSTEQVAEIVEEVIQKNG
jgi:predicted phosphate transport protein (TIGR00153 family)